MQAWTETAVSMRCLRLFGAGQEFQHALHALWMPDQVAMWKKGHAAWARMLWSLSHDADFAAEAAARPLLPVAIPASDVPLGWLDAGAKDEL